MSMLRPLALGRRLFTYKVAHDAGSAPNPYFGVCTLGICKPAIRRVAKPGDVVVGLGCGSEERRIVYCMEVERVVSWQQYIDACHGRLLLEGFDAVALRKKIPTGLNDPGDCIWPDGTRFEEALPSWSRHSGSCFDVDVSDGRNVLLSTRFWYFGRGEGRAAIQLPSTGALRHIIPGRGHRSDANNDFRDRFVQFFNDELDDKGIRAFGEHGTAALDSTRATEAEHCRCRELANEFDQEGEERLDHAGSDCGEPVARITAKRTC